MSQRRMFSPDIVCSEEFLDMPTSSRELYFQLAIRADDDGFIQPKLVMKTVGASEDDLKVLLAKRFLLHFERGVVVIKHWLIHNMIRLDRYKPTRFQEEKKMLSIKDNKAYTGNENYGLQSGNQMAPQVRLGEVSIGKVRLETSTPPKVAYGDFKGVLLTVEEHQKLIDLFGEKNTQLLIFDLDTYIASKGKKYKSHYATILAWARRKLTDHGKNKIVTV